MNYFRVEMRDKKVMEHGGLNNRWSGEVPILPYSLNILLVTISQDTLRVPILGNTFIDNL